MYSFSDVTHPNLQGLLLHAPLHPPLRLIPVNFPSSSRASYTEFLCLSDKWHSVKSACAADFLIYAT